MADVYLIRQYVDQDGHSPFQEWQSSLDSQAAAAVAAKIDRLRRGNTSAVKSVGSGVYELKVSFGPGYRVYFGYADRTVVILVGGGTKQRQSRDIMAAKATWLRYKDGTNPGEV